MRNAILFAGVILAVFTARADAECPVTVREAVKRVRPLEISRTRELTRVPFQEIVAASDLIVEGVVEPIGTFVSADGCYIYTDYAVTPRNLIAGRLRSATQPGPSLVVRQWGGDTTIDGVKVTFRDKELPPLQAGNMSCCFLLLPSIRMSTS